MCISVAWNGPLRVAFEFNWRKMLNSRLLNPSPDKNCLWHSRKRTASLSFYACANSRAHPNMQCGLSLPVPLCARMRDGTRSAGIKYQMCPPSGFLRPTRRFLLQVPQLWCILFTQIKKTSNASLKYKYVMASCLCLPISGHVTDWWRKGWKRVNFSNSLSGWRVYLFIWLG